MGREVISCCTGCVHFPDGLSSLLPDLVCVVLHRQVICVRSRAAVAPLHPFIHITQIRVEFVTFAVLCPVSSLAWSYMGLFVEGPTGLCAILASYEYLFVLFLFFVFLLSSLCLSDVVMCTAV